jgi:tetratricopeptide (TPR) repeat protein
MDGLQQSNKQIILLFMAANEEYSAPLMLDDVLPQVNGVVFQNNSGDVNSKTLELVSEKVKSFNKSIHTQNKPFIDFSTNRNELISFAKTIYNDDNTYFFMMDADDGILGGFNKESLDLDCYHITISYGVTYQRPVLWRSNINLFYKGKVHEYVSLPPGCTFNQLKTIIILGNKHDLPNQAEIDGNNKNNFYKKLLLEDEQNQRTTFYLAQTLFDMGEIEEALKHYLLVDSFEVGNIQEKFYSYYKAGSCAELLGLSYEVISGYYLKAITIDPKRFEPLYKLARLNRERNNYFLAALYSYPSLLIKDVPEVMFIEHDVYEWKLLEEFTISAFYTQAYKKFGLEATKELLTRNFIPERLISIRKTLKFYLTS